MTAVMSDNGGWGDRVWILAKTLLWIGVIALLGYLLVWRPHFDKSTQAMTERLAEQLNDGDTEGLSETQKVLADRGCMTIVGMSLQSRDADELFDYSGAWMDLMGKFDAEGAGWDVTGDPSDDYLAVGAVAGSFCDESPDEVSQILGALNGTQWGSVFVFVPA
jgi:hypothetical protein